MLRRVEHGNQDASSVGPLVLDLTTGRNGRKVTALKYSILTLARKLEIIIAEIKKVIEVNLDSSKATSECYLNVFLS